MYEVLSSFMPLGIYSSSIMSHKLHWRGTHTTYLHATLMVNTITMNHHWWPFWSLQWIIIDDHFEVYNESSLMIILNPSLQWINNDESFWSLQPWQRCWSKQYEATKRRGSIRWPPVNEVLIYCSLTSILIADRQNHWVFTICFEYFAILIFSPQYFQWRCHQSQ